MSAITGSFCERTSCAEVCPSIDLEGENNNGSENPVKPRKRMASMEMKANQERNNAR